MNSSLQRYYQQNKVYVLERNKKYALEHKEEIRAKKQISTRKWYILNKVSKLEANSKWQRENPEKMLSYQPDNNTRVKLRYCIESGSEAHHVLSRKDYPQFQFVVSNGITLCRPCHNEYTWGDKS